MVMMIIVENDVLVCNNVLYVYVFDFCLNLFLDGYVMGNLEFGNVNVGSFGKVEFCILMVFNFIFEVLFLDW